MTDTLDQRMFDANVRVQTMFWIGGISIQPPEEFEEFVEDDLADSFAILDVFPWAKPIGEEGDAEDFIATLTRKGIDGFIVELATPIPTSFHGTGGYSFSWGYIQTKWFYFKTLEAIADGAETFARQVVEEARASHPHQHGEDR